MHQTQGGKNRKKSAKYRRYIACRRGAKRQMEEISRPGDFSPKITKKIGDISATQDKSVI